MLPDDYVILQIQFMKYKIHGRPRVVKSKPYISHNSGFLNVFYYQGKVKDLCTVHNRGVDLTLEVK